MAGWAAGVFTRARNWVNDKNGAINPQAALFDQEDDNFATGLNNCVTKDGLNKPSASMDWNGQILTNVARITALGAGSAAAPTIALSATAGLYADTANQIAVSLNGLTAGQIAQGTQSLTVTVGLSTTPSVNAVWQRFMNTVIVFIPAVTGAASGTGFTLSALPAAIRPTTVQAVAVGSLYSATTTVNGGMQINTDGTLQGLVNGGVGNFSGAGTKGIISPIVLIFTLN